MINGETQTFWQASKGRLGSQCLKKGLQPSPHASMWEPQSRQSDYRRMFTVRALKMVWRDRCTSGEVLSWRSTALLQGAQGVMQLELVDLLLLTAPSAVNALPRRCVQMQLVVRE